MSRRNTISREFFATIAAVLVLGLSVMCAIQTALSAAYFIGERKSSLTDVLNGATALSERFADEGSIVTKPLQGEDVLERAHSGFELFNTASGALVFIADENGQILLHTGDDAFTGAGVPASYIDELNEGNDIFETGTLDGVYCAKYYTAGRRITVGGQDGYLFAASPMAALGSYMTDMLTMFGISAAVILILCSILCWVLAKRITGPIEDISEAARRLGSGDFTARAPVDGCVELADFATTFNNMAARLQTIDNSRGQFMGNIAHELRTPMTTIKGFIDGILDGTIPPDMQNHYLQLVSEETGRLARLIQNMLDLSKLESGEYQVNARMFNIWETLTGVALSAEQRINDGMIDIDGLTMDEKVLVYADPDLIHQVAYNLLDNAIEACLKLEEAKRRIEVSVLRDEAYADGDAKLYVSIINTSLPVHIEKDCIATTKLEPHLHGFGLPCAKELLRRNNAFYTMDYHDGAFQFCFEWPDVACNSCVHA